MIVVCSQVCNAFHKYVFPVPLDAARGAQNAEVLLFAGEEEMRVLCSLALIASAAAEGHDGHDHGGASYERVAASESTRFNES